MDRFVGDAAQYGIVMQSTFRILERSISAPLAFWSMAMCNQNRCTAHEVDEMLLLIPLHPFRAVSNALHFVLRLMCHECVDIESFERCTSTADRCALLSSCRATSRLYVAS